MSSGSMRNSVPVAAVEAELFVADSFSQLKIKIIVANTNK
jgi:hypothetical protein